MFKQYRQEKHDYTMSLSFVSVSSKSLITSFFKAYEIQLLFSRSKQNSSWMFDDNANKMSGSKYAKLVN
jgi:hypothetical protein